jgi:hypothetical protein
MKLKKVHLILAIAALTILFSGCKKDNATTNAADIANQLTASTWSIHYLLYNTDLTTQFSSYTFTFKKDSSVSVVNSTEAYTGVWFTQKQSDNSVSLNIQINSGSSIRFVNNNWKIVTNDGALITMLDYSSAAREFHLFRR